MNRHVPSQRQHIIALLTCVALTSCITTASASPMAQPADDSTLGQHEALRVYTEFADGTHRGMYEAQSGVGGYPDEDYDATVAMVINWHRMPEQEEARNARLRYRQAHPESSEWIAVEGESYEFWHREELVNRVVITDLEPNTVYAFEVAQDGERFHLRTMPASLDDRPVTIVMTGDHQRPGWNSTAHDNARMAALQKPDMFVVGGDYVNCEGMVTAENARRWALYLDTLYGVGEGYFHYSDEIDGQTFNNLVIPHVGVLGNHETGRRHHIRWPGGVMTNSSEPGYPQFVAANWMQLLFHWPFSSEGFYSEFRPDHPNMDSNHVRDDFGKGGFGKLSFGDYLMLLALDNNQNWEGLPDQGLRDWQGELITERWPWFETHHSDVRQDLWLEQLMEPDDGPTAGERYQHILPIWHRGLFGTGRKNMTLKNRGLLQYWFPILYRNDIKLVKECHDHLYCRTIPLNMTTEQPDNTYLDTLTYAPRSWNLSNDLPQSYLDAFHTITVLRDEQSDEIVGWAYAGHYTTYDPQGMIVIGCGGWAAGRRSPGSRGGGNAGLWFVDNDRGGDSFGGGDSYHMTTVHLADEHLTVEAFHPRELAAFESGDEPSPIHRFRWEMDAERWLAEQQGQWVDYADGMKGQ